jgi:hypothetical protein
VIPEWFLGGISENETIASLLKPVQVAASRMHSDEAGFRHGYGESGSLRSKICVLGWSRLMLGRCFKLSFIH